MMLFHHCLSLIGLGITFTMGKYGTEMVATICGAELTNPLLQLRWFLREVGKSDTLLAEVVDHAFMISFGLLRIGVGTILLYCYFKQPTDLLGRFGGVVIYTIGWIFWISILQYAIKKYKKIFKARKSSKTNSMNETSTTWNSGGTNKDKPKTSISTNGCDTSTFKRTSVNEKIKINDVSRNRVNGYIRGFADSPMS